MRNKPEVLSSPRQFILLWNILRWNDYDAALNIVFPLGTLSQKIQAVRKTQRKCRLFKAAFLAALKSISGTSLNEDDVYYTKVYLKRIKPHVLKWIENVTQKTIEKCEGNAIGREG